MSIAFLSKKSWHPHTIANSEKVWIAEEAAKKEAAAIREVQRRLKEERSVEEMKALHDRHAEKVTGVKKAQRLDWMYEGAAAHKPDPDEYLLGKRQATDDTQAGTQEVKKLLSGEVPGSTWLARPKPTEEFNRVHEDPLTRMQRAQEKALQDVLANPMKMAKIKRTVSKEKTKKQLRKEKKKLKKLKKKARKAMKKASKSKKQSKKSIGESGSGSDSSSDSGPDQGKASSTVKIESASPLPAVKVEVKAEPVTSGTSARQRHRSRSRSRSRDRARRSSSSYDRRGRSNSHRSRSRDTEGRSRGKDRRSSRRRSRSRSRSRSRDRRHDSRRHRRRSEPRSRSRSQSRSRSRSRSRRDRRGSSATYSARTSTEPQQTRRSGEPARGRRPKLSAEERAQRLAEMQADAEKNDELRDERLKVAKEAEDRQERRDKLRALVMQGKKGFLGATRRSAYQGDAALKLMQSQKFKHQKDQSSEAFMDRNA